MHASPAQLGQPAKMSGAVYVLAAVALIMHLATAGRYGYFRDELYYLACSRHLAWGYVDHPPLVVALTWLIRHTLGESLLALRLLPSAAMATVVLLTGWMARELDGNRFAQTLAALAAALSPALIVMGTFLSMNPIDILLWALICCVLLRLLQCDRLRNWIILGVLFGVGLLNKYNIAFLGAALAAALLLTPQRRWWTRRGPWLAVGMAVLISGPHWVWQVANGWPTLEFLRNIKAHKNYPVSPIEFVGMQFAIVHPLVFPIWVAGLVHLFRRPKHPAFRLFAWTYAILFVGFMLLQAKFYYLFPIYPVLFAAGGVAWERATEKTNQAWLRPALATALVIGAGFTLPLALPVLSFNAFLRYHRMLDIQRHLRFEQGRDRELPIIYADMIGWPQLVADVARVRNALPAAERDAAVILTANYGQAGAIDRFGPAQDLPPAVCPHNSYHTWGPGPRPWHTVIAVGFAQEELENLFASVTPAGTSGAANAREASIPLHVCRQRALPRNQAWARLRAYR